MVGNTSVGKSSVLESISGVQFPTGADVTTTCPIRLILRESSTFAAKVSGVNVSDKSLIGQQILSAMTRGTKPTMLRATPVFAGTVIEVELHEPGLPDLTLLDLPGILNSGPSKEFVKPSSSSTLHVSMLIMETSNSQSNICATYCTKGHFA